MGKNKQVVTSQLEKNPHFKKYTPMKDQIRAQVSLTINIESKTTEKRRNTHS